MVEQTSVKKENASGNRANNSQKAGNDTRDKRRSSLKPRNYNETERNGKRAGTSNNGRTRKITAGGFAVAPKRQRMNNKEILKSLYFRRISLLHRRIDKKTYTSHNLKKKQNGGCL